MSGKIIIGVMFKSLAPAGLSLLLLLSVACGEGATDSPYTPFTSTPAPTPATDRLVPPLEGPGRPAAATERTNFRELPDFQLPLPGDSGVKDAGDKKGQEFNPPEEAQCPEEWEVLRRPLEGFEVCYPKEWVLRGHGYLSAGAEDRWYAVGIVLLDGEVEVAHVSIYVMNAFARPVTYTRECEQLYRVKLSGEDAVLCPDHPATSPEVKIIAYHVRKGDLDYFVNVVPKYTYDAEEGRYTDKWDKDALAAAIEIAHTFKFTPLLSPS